MVDNKEEDLVVEEKTNERDTPDYWRRWIKAVKKASKIHFENSEDAWEEYESEEDRPYPIYWSSVKTLEPAYYSRTPQITTEREFGTTDPVALTASLVAERVGKHLVKENNFDSVMQKSVLDFINADKSTVQVSYSADFVDEETRVPLTPSPDGVTYIDSNTEAPFEDEVFKDETGFFGNVIQKIPTNQKVHLLECSYDEILHTPEAKCESEIREKAFYFIMDRSEAEGRFGKEVADKINWKTKKDAAMKEGQDIARDLTDIIGEYVEGWECWCLPTKWVYWISDQYQEGFLDSKEDPYKLWNFFPSPKFIISNRPSKTMYPRPAHTKLKNCIAQLHDSADRVAKLSAGCKRRALVDGADDDLIAALNSSEEGEYIAMTNLAKIVEKGGLENSVLFIPIVELVKAITELSQLQEKFKKEFFEWFGVPDILRGASDPLETYGAQRIKSNEAHNRFKFQKKQVAQLARDAIEMMTDLALALYNEDLIKEICGFNFMSQEHQQRFPEALAMLRNPTIRIVRLAIDTDSMTFVEEEQRAFKAQQVTQTLTAGLEQIYKMLELSPDYAATGLQALLLALNAISPGKEFEDSVKKSVTALIQKAQEPKPEKPPEPNVDLMKVQIESQRLQLDTQVKTRDLERKELQVQFKNQENLQKQQVSALENQVKAQNIQFDNQISQFMAELEAQRVAIEQFKAGMSAKESQMEEIRLAAEVEAKIMEASKEEPEERGEEKGSGVTNIINLPSVPSMPTFGL